MMSNAGKGMGMIIVAVARGMVCLSADLIVGRGSR